MSYEDEIDKRRTFAVISHPDAGKTTLTEKFLLFGGAIQVAGAVKSNPTNSSPATSNGRAVSGASSDPGVITVLLANLPSATTPSPEARSAFASSSPSPDVPPMTNEGIRPPLSANWSGNHPRPDRPKRTRLSLALRSEDSTDRPATRMLGDRWPAVPRGKRPAGTTGPARRRRPGHTPRLVPGGQGHLATPSGRPLRKTTPADWRQSLDLTSPYPFRQVTMTCP